VLQLIRAEFFGQAASGDWKGTVVDPAALVAEIADARQGRH